MINKNKVLAATAIISIVFAGVGILLIASLSLLGTKFVAIKYIAPVAIGLFLSHQAIIVILNVHMVEEVKALLIANTKKAFDLKILTNQMVLVIVGIIFPFILGFSLVIVNTDIGTVQYAVLFIFLFIQGWVSEIYSYRYNYIYKSYLNKAAEYKQI